MIPNTIHFIWMTKEAARMDDPIPEEVRDQIFRWHHHAADCAIRCWSWADFEDLMDDPEGQRTIDLIRACRLNAMKADIMRLAIIARLGGIWSDVKNRPRIDLRGQLPLHEKLFIAEHWPIPQKADTTGFYSNSFFGAEADNGFINATLDFALDKVAARAAEDSIPWITGGGVFTRLSKRDSMEQPYPIRADVAWQEWIQRVGMEYNKGGKHWSERQKSEPLYA